ncbi:hypothetical protein AB0L40_05280 [Patulibacter sp. NPDC049589]|uniref:hypothetical protein n=1 Tax=Patulibacter sp. NPDC049589 TaxID=3154731 RepID=UPI0034367C21
MSARRRPRRCGCIAALALVPFALVVVLTLGFTLALGGTPTDCQADGPGGLGGPAGPDPTRSAAQDIPPDRLALYRRAGGAEDIDWTFLASIGAQECDHGACRGDNGSGCAGPMQIAMRRGSPCSPGSGPTLWDQYKTDGDHDGHTDVNDPADAIFTAARILRRAKHAPATGGGYARYRQAACSYYGACADGVAAYADQVMRRAVQYGFHGIGSPAASDFKGAQATLDLPPEPPDGSGTCAGSTGLQAGDGELGPVRKATGPRHLAPLPRSVVASGFGSIRCDARIVPDVVVLARRFRVWVSACVSIHSLAGEHPLGAAVDLVPADGNWDRTARLAKAIGWKASCAASGVAPNCAKPPFRFVGYNGYPAHGDPAHCVPCGGGPHLHLSWLTSASQGEPQNQPRTGYFAPDWIDVFDPAASSGVGDA